MRISQSEFFDYFVLCLVSVLFLFLLFKILVFKLFSLLYRFEGTQIKNFQSYISHLKEKLVADKNFGDKELLLELLANAIRIALICISKQKIRGGNSCFIRRSKINERYLDFCMFVCLF